MKKFFAFALIAGTLVACNNEAETTATPDSTSLTVDSTTVISVDTSAGVSDSASGGAMMDTSAAPADTTKK